MAIYITIINSVILIALSPPFLTDQILENHAPIIDPRTIQKPTIQSTFPSRAKINSAARE